MSTNYKESIMVTGAAGQLGTVMVPALRNKYGNDNVVAAPRPRGTPLLPHIRDSGPYAFVDVTARDGFEDHYIGDVIDEHGIKVIYHMPGLLSAGAEQKRRQAFNINYFGLFNVLETAMEHGVDQVIVPSSIAALGPFDENTPRTNTPNDSRQRPMTSYGIAKVTGEMWADYYSKLGLDVRGARLPGILTVETEPNPHGTTDYANAAIFDAVRKGYYDGCPLPPDAKMHFMTDSRAAEMFINLSEADKRQLTHAGDYNVGDLVITPRTWANAISAVGPELGITDFKMEYEIDPLRLKTQQSWTESLDTSDAIRDGILTPPPDTLEETAYGMIKSLQKKSVPVEA